MLKAIGVELCCNREWYAACATTAESVLGDGAAFTGELKLVRKPTGYEKGRRPTGSWVAGLRERTFLAPFDASVTHRFL